MQVILTLLAYIVVALPVWRIMDKMGYPAPIALLVFIPFVGLIALYLAAFQKWPIERDYEYLLLERDRTAGAVRLDDRGSPHAQ